MSLCRECEPGFPLQSSPKKKNEPTADSKFTVSKTQKTYGESGGEVEICQNKKKTPLLTLFLLGKK